MAKLKRPAGKVFRSGVLGSALDGVYRDFEADSGAKTYAHGDAVGLDLSKAVHIIDASNAAGEATYKIGAGTYPGQTITIVVVATGDTSGSVIVDTAGSGTRLGWTTFTCPTTKTGSATLTWTGSKWAPTSAHGDDAGVVFA